VSARRLPPFMTRGGGKIAHSVMANMAISGAAISAWNSRYLPTSSDQAAMTNLAALAWTLRLRERRKVVAYEER